MKDILVLIFVIFLFQTTRAQDTIKHYELGPTIIGMQASSNYYGYFVEQHYPLQIMNGLFFRCVKNRIGFRAQLDYSKGHDSYIPGDGCSDCQSVYSDTKDFRIGAGVQFSVINEKDWLYTFTDLSYRKLLVDASVSGGISGGTYSFTSKQKGAETALGMGFRLKIFKSVYLSPELSYIIFYNSREYRETYPTYATPNKTTVMQQNIFAKLHLTVKF
jgi:hypothetical protein